MSFGRYSAIVGGTVLISLGALRFPLAPASWRAAGAGALLAAANALAAFFLVRWSLGRSNALFFQAILGGTAARMLFLLGGAVGALLGLGLPKVPFVAGLLGYFALFLVLELAVVQRTEPPVAAEGGR